MEDFGYIKDEEKKYFSANRRKIALIIGSILSVAAFIYVTINAYYYVYQDENSNIEVIKSPEEPIKIIEGEQQSQNSAPVDHTIYEDIFGNNKSKILKATDNKIQKSQKEIIPPRPVEPVTKTVAKEERTVEKNEKIINYSTENKTVANNDFLTKTTETKNEKKENTVQNKKRYARVQIAAMASKQAAEDYWEKLNRLYPNLFSGLKIYIEEVNLGKKGIFYRLQIGNFFNQVNAEEFCNKYVTQAHKTRADCIVVE